MTPVIADYPILAENKLDYIAGNAYTVEAHDFGQSGRKQIQHRLEGQNLVRDLICEGSAAFACVVVAAECAYRHIEVADAAELNWSEQTVSCEQSLALQTDEYAAPVVFQAFHRYDVSNRCHLSNRATWRLSTVARGLTS